MKNIKLVALDLDGTLFNKESIISKRNLDTIKKASELGIASSRRHFFVSNS